MTKATPHSAREGQRLFPLRILTAVLLLAVSLAGCAHQETRPEPQETSTRTHPGKPPAKHEHPKRHGWFAQGLASYYGPGLWGNLTASGSRLKKSDKIAAHRTLPFGTCLVVQNVDNGRSVRVKVQDRGPYVKDRILDVSMAAGRALGMLEKGLAHVRLFRCGHEPVDLREAGR
jgi:rare lipoprotein A